jgi:hypothetical protein
MGRGLAAHRYPTIFLGCYLARRQVGSRVIRPSSAYRVPLLRLPAMRSATKG